MSTFGGENILLNDDQYFKILQGWDAGGDEFAVGDRRIPRKAVSYLGFSKEAAEQIRIDESEYERSLPPAEAKKLREMKYQYALKAVSQKNSATIASGRDSYERRWKSIGGKELVVKLEKESTADLPMSDDEEMRGDQMYWVDDLGEKHYS